MDKERPMPGHAHRRDHVEAVFADLQQEFRGMLPARELAKLADEEVHARRSALLPELVPVFARRSARRRARLTIDANSS